MAMTKQTITIPDNMELVKTSETEYKIVEKKKELPKSWKEFCENHPIREGEAWLCGSPLISVANVSIGNSRNSLHDSCLPNKEYAEAILALCQLIQLRDCYRQGWKPDWTEDSISKATIGFFRNKIERDFSYNVRNILAFQTVEVRDKFLSNFKDLIEKITPLFM